MLAVCLYRVDVFRGGSKQNDKDCDILENSISRVIPVLEKLAGTTLEELGLGGYYFLHRITPAEVIANANAWAESFKTAEVAAL